MEVAEATSSNGAEPLFKKRSAKSKSTFRKRPATPPPDNNDSDSSGYSSSEDESGRRVKRQRRNVGVVKAASSQTAPSVDLSTTQYIADRSNQIEANETATKRSNWFDEDAKKKSDDLDAKSLLGTTRQQTGDSDGTYKGASNYQSFVQKNPDAPSRQVGPIKAPSNVRTITVTDFAPDVCKDYKQTGFCGFGDSCKFLHAREDYKQGWQLDRDWEIGGKGKKAGGQIVASANRSAKLGDGGAEDDGDDEMLAKIPFACIICKRPYTSPIITKCGHYFCENCALQRYRKNPACAACGSGTGGVFNTAKNLRKLLDKKKDREERRKEKEKEEGLDDDEARA